MDKWHTWDLNPSDSESRAWALSALASQGLQMVLEWPPVKLPVAHLQRKPFTL